jgi:hypothetical protein
MKRRVYDYCTCNLFGHKEGKVRTEEAKGRKDGEPKEELSKNLHLEFLLHFQKPVTTSERILSVFVGQVTFSNQAYKKSPRAECVRL